MPWNGYVLYGGSTGDYCGNSHAVETFSNRPSTIAAVNADYPTGQLDTGVKWYSGGPDYVIWAHRGGGGQVPDGMVEDQVQLYGSQQVWMTLADGSSSASVEADALRHYLTGPDDTCGSDACSWGSTDISEQDALFRQIELDGLIEGTDTTPLTPAAPTLLQAPAIQQANPLATYVVSTDSGLWWSTAGVPPPTYSYQWLRCDVNGANCVSDGTTTASDFLTTDDAGHTMRVVVTATNQYGTSTPAESAASAIVQLPLDAFAPQLRYDSNEGYSADEVTEAAGDCTTAYSQLIDANGASFANSCGIEPITGDPVPVLTPGFLGATYGDGSAATSSDYIDLSDNYDQGYAALHPYAADTIYGREVSTPNGGEVLQYWFYYYTQPNFFWGVGGAHEGDWEGIQVEIDSDGDPTSTAYFQHHGGESCTWGTGTSVGLHPVVFVASGSHASYYFPGTHPLPLDGTDTADGLLRAVIPTVVDITQVQPSWVGWPGRWGGTTDDTAPDWVGQTSPVGPAFAGEKWDDPAGWQAQQTCEEQ